METLLRNFFTAVSNRKFILPFSYVNNYPEIPEGWTINIHQGIKNDYLNLKKISLFISDKQKNQEQGCAVSWKNLFSEFAEKQITLMNASVLDYLLKNQKLIPDSWKSHCIFFWGTIFQAPNNQLMVKFINWSGKEFISGYTWLESGVCKDESSAILEC